MPQCCAFGCSFQAKKGGKLYRLPSELRNAARRRVWLMKISRENWEPTGDARLCANHFTPDQFETNRADGLVKLKPNAVPTIFCHRKTPVVRKAPSERKQVFQECPKETVIGEASDEPSSSIPVVMDTTEDEVTALKNQVQQLQDEIQTLKRQLNLSQKREKKVSVEKDNLLSTLHDLFDADQLTVLAKGTCKGSKWSLETLQKALKIRLACGKKGYDLLLENKFPFPSDRTLRRTLQNVKFRPGILRELMDSLKVKLDLMLPEEKHAVLMMDEVSITPSLEYDSSIGCVIGNATIPPAKSVSHIVASHALVFMLGGITSRWKQTIGYHYTGPSFSSPCVKEIINTIITECESIGIKIHCVISDMGGQNQAVWREFGITVGRFSKLKNSCQHPCDDKRKLLFLADTPHILKNLRNHLVCGQSIYLPQNIVEKHELPCNEVKIDHVKQLFEIDSSLSLKLAPQLRERCVMPNHYDKMKVGLATALINNQTAAAIEYAVKTGKLPTNALTTAWFLRQVHKWFCLMTSRSPAVALSVSNKEKYNEALDHLKDTVSLFENVKIGQKGIWKPVQSGVLLTTAGILELQHTFLNENGFKFLLTGRFTQDALENLFSMVRFKNPVPTPREFKSALRVISLTQFFTATSNYSDEVDDSGFLAKLIGETVSENEQQYTEEVCEQICEPVCGTVCGDEQQSLYYLCGHIVRQVMKRNTLCDLCKKSLLAPEESSSSSVNMLLNFKSFTETSLTRPSMSVFNVMQTVELYLRSNKYRILMGELLLADLASCVINSLKEKVIFPPCHNVQEKIIHSYLLTRIHLLLREENKNYQGLVAQGSRSMAMRKLVQKSGPSVSLCDK